MLQIIFYQRLWMNGIKLMIVIMLTALMTVNIHNLSFMKVSCIVEDATFNVGIHLAK